MTTPARRGRRGNITQGLTGETSLIYNSSRGGVRSLAVGMGRYNVTLWPFVCVIKCHWAFFDVLGRGISFSALAGVSWVLDGAAAVCGLGHLWNVCV